MRSRTRAMAMSKTGIAELPTYDDGKLLAVIEATHGSANKFKFDPARGAFVLHKVLPPGTAFPFDFGFVPATLGEDGDPLDVLVLMDVPVPPGVVVPCRLLGVIEATQREMKGPRGAPVRNDRLIAVAHMSHRHANCRSLRDLGAHLLGEIEAFFVFYNLRMGKTFAPIGRGGLSAARRLVAAGRRGRASVAQGGR